ncbi:unnamed protein product [Owenia fusiformis]|uniref:Uncharacterized protein n=1 Tax=Owenia fusiformis TaxID=6347 RepID=A0A8J1UGG8_OWEFU|nr:unnamed protein product [Owenia fusiformis]
MVPVLVAIALGLLLAYIWNKTRSKLTHIPGPTGLPILGNTLEVGSSFKLICKMEEWARKYGDVFKFNIFGDEIVVVSGSAIGEVLVTKGSEFAGRPKYPWFEKLEGGETHLFMREYDPKLRFIRKLVHRGLRQYGEGVDRIESISVVEISKCLDNIEREDGADFDPFTYIHHAVSQVMNTMLTGEALSEGHPMLNKAIKLDKIDAELSTSYMLLTITDKIPLLDKMTFIPAIRKVKEYTQILDSLINFWTGFEATYDKNNMRGLYDVVYKAYLESESSEEGTKLSYTNVKYLMYELYLAGIITTNKTIYAFVHLMVTYPNIQKRIQSQIDEVVSSQRKLTTEDRHKLPLLEATIHEVLRFTSIVPMTVHKTTKDTSVGGFAIPNDTQVWPIFTSNHHNAEYFIDPLTFNPDRFLEQDGSLSPPESRKMLMPFGAGTRNCIGEVFARMRLFLFTASLLQRFTLLQPTKGKFGIIDPKSEEYLKMTPCICPSYKIRAIPRAWGIYYPKKKT